MCEGSCAWCREPLPRQALTLPFMFHETPTGRHAFTRVFAITVNGTRRWAVPVRAGSPDAKAGYHAVFLVCSESCADALRADVLPDTLKPPPPKTARRAHRPHSAKRPPDPRVAALEHRLLELCAWCYQPIPEDEEARGVLTNLVDTEPPPGRIVMLLDIGGEPHHAIIRPPAPGNFDLGFFVCSHACRDALDAALERDRGRVR